MAILWGTLNSVGEAIGRSVELIDVIVLGAFRENYFKLDNRCGCCCFHALPFSFWSGHRELVDDDGRCGYDRRLVHLRRS